MSVVPIAYHLVQFVLPIALLECVFYFLFLAVLFREDELCNCYACLGACRKRWPVDVSMWTISKKRVVRRDLQRCANDVAPFAIYDGRQSLQKIRLLLFCPSMGVKLAGITAKFLKVEYLFAGRWFPVCLDVFANLFASNKAANSDDRVGFFLPAAIKKYLDRQG